MKKFTSSECLDELIQRIKDNPLLIRNFITLHTYEQTLFFNNTLWKAVFDHNCWTRVSTKRPPPDENSCGSDKEIRIYENDVWIDSGHILEGVVTTEYENITDVKFNIKTQF